MKRQDFLDALRALCALYVVIFHIWQFWYEKTISPALPAAVVPYLAWMGFGRSAVSVFIVISGYCLMMPFAADPSKQIDPARFFKRRAWRILPPYYIALVLAIAAAFAIPGEAATKKDIIAHVLLLHNMNPQFAYTIDAPMWSVATEVQIYLLFPFLALPLWKRFGNTALVIAFFAIGEGLFLLFPSLKDASPWYTGLFALGMVASALRRQERRLPWLELSGVFFALFVFILLAVAWRGANPYSFVFVWYMDALIGLSAACLIVGYPKREKPGFLEWPPLVKLGGMSYSLYLCHFPVLLALRGVFRGLNIGGGQKFVLLLVAGLTCSLLVSWIFYEAVEKRFIAARS